MAAPTPGRISILEPLRKYFETGQRELTRFEALCYLILNGPEVNSSLRDLAKTFDWSRSKLDSFIAALAEKATIEPIKSQEGTTIKVSQVFYIAEDSKPAKKEKSHKPATNQATSEPPEPADPALHPSPNAPAWLARETQELLAYEESYVYFSVKQLAMLQAKLQPAEFEYWITSMDRYFRSEPKKYRRYKSHYLVLLRWRERRLADGLVWADLPGAGPNYFKQEVVDKHFRLS